jgi:hypothetical protein
VTVEYAVAGRLLSITRIALSAAAADVVVVHVGASGSTTVSADPGSIATVSALAFTVNRSKNHPIPLRIEVSSSAPAFGQSTGGNHSLSREASDPDVSITPRSWTYTLRFGA